MPLMKYAGVTINYEEFGSGYPLVLFAPGSLNSTIKAWHKLATIDPTAEFADQFRVIAMDQRNSGDSFATMSMQDGWHSYTADHIALLDHLGIERAHIAGQCIGAPFCFSLMKAQPARVSAAVLIQPSGRMGPFPGPTIYFDKWANGLQNHPEATPELVRQFALNLYTPDFVWSVTRDFVKNCRIPMLVMRGNDPYHPPEVSAEIVRLAPDVEDITDWQEGEARQAAIRKMREFMLKHVPAGVAAR